MGVDSTLWEQMTAREGRDAARRAGMRAGDWQAEKQLQEALRESRLVRLIPTIYVAELVGFYYQLERHLSRMCVADDFDFIRFPKRGGTPSVL